MKEQNVADVKYEAVFKVDFCNYLVQELKLQDRQQAKDLFMFFLNSNGYVPDYKSRILFLVTLKFIANLKPKNYKDASYFQREKKYGLMIYVKTYQLILLYLFTIA